MALPDGVENGEASLGQATHEFDVTITVLAVIVTIATASSSSSFRGLASQIVDPLIDDRKLLVGAMPATPPAPIAPRPHPGNRAVVAPQEKEHQGHTDGAEGLGEQDAEVAKGRI